MITVTKLSQRGRLARQAAGIGSGWLPSDSDPILALICERLDDDDKRSATLQRLLPSTSIIFCSDDGYVFVDETQSNP